MKLSTLSIQTAFVLIICGAAGCTRAVSGGSGTTPENIDLTAPVKLFPAADALRGKSIEEFLTIADAVAEPAPLSSGVIREVAATASPAVVSIFTQTRTPYRFRFIPVPSSGHHFSLDGEALGSGFFINAEGYILTNAHVLENATAIIAHTEGGKDFPVEIIALDPVYDLALIRVTAPDGPFPVIPMMDASKARVGDWVIAIGNPLGLGHTVTHGIISQTGRKLFPDIKEGERQIEFLQTDTPINPGSSGGPLVTLDGHFVGVNTAVLVNSQGISFCVPSTQVREFISTVLKGR